MMNEPLTDRETGASLLSRVQKDMKAYDHGGHEIGRVVRVYLGEDAEARRNPGAQPVTNQGTGTRLNDTAPDFAFGGAGSPDDSDVNVTVRNRLLHEGFVEIYTGIFSGNRYAMPDQLEDVREDGVYLSIDGKDGLVRV